MKTVHIHNDYVQIDGRKYTPTRTSKYRLRHVLQDYMVTFRVLDMAVGIGNGIDTYEITDNDYTIDNRYGYITDPGKFEYEQWYVPELWWHAEDWCDRTVYDDQDDKPYFVFYLSNLPMIGSDDYALILYERDGGFVISDIRTELGFDFWLREEMGIEDE